MEKSSHKRTPEHHFITYSFLVLIIDIRLRSRRLVIFTNFHILFHCFDRRFHFLISLFPVKGRCCRPNKRILIRYHRTKDTTYNTGINKISPRSLLSLTILFKNAE